MWVIFGTSPPAARPSVRLSSSSVSPAWSLQKRLRHPPQTFFPPSSCVRVPSSSCHRVEAGARALHIAKPPLVGPLRCSFWPFCIRQDETLKKIRLQEGAPIFFFKSPSPFYRQHQKRATITSAAVCAEKHLVGVVDYCEDGLKPWAGGQSYGWVFLILYPGCT